MVEVHFQIKVQRIQDGLAAWYEIGLNHTESLVNHVKIATSSGQDLDESIGM